MLMVGCHWNWYEQGPDIIGDHDLPWEQVDWLNMVHKLLDVFNVVGEWPIKGLMILASSFMTLLVTAPLLDTIGLRGVPTLLIFGVHKTVGELCWLDIVFCIESH